MRHRLKGRKLGMTDAHRRRAFANMASALVTHEQLRTTLPRAKELSRVTDKLITLAKGGLLHQRRAAMSELGDREAVDKMWKVLAPRYQNRNGGYTRVLKMGVRYGDCASMAVIELVERDVDAKGREDKARHAAAQAESQEREKREKQRVGADKQKMAAERKIKGSAEKNGKKIREKVAKKSETKKTS